MVKLDIATADWSRPRHLPERDLTGTLPTLTDRARPNEAGAALPFALFFYVRDEASTHMVVDFAENPLVSAGFWTARLTAPAVWPRKA
jgi:hypothetical protein